MYDWTETRETTASPEALWEVYADVTGWPTWNGAIVGAKIDGPFASGTTGYVSVSMGLSQDVPFRLENVVPFERFDVVWTVVLTDTRVTHEIQRTATGSRFTHAHHTSGATAVLSFARSWGAHDRAPRSMEIIARRAEALTR